MRTNPYPMNDPKDFSMLTQPKLRLNYTVIVWDEDEGGEWVQARVVDATFNRKKKCWEYSAVVEFVDSIQTPAKIDSIFIEEGQKFITTEYSRTEHSIEVKDWYYFSDEEIQTNQWFDNLTFTEMYIVIKQ